MILRKIKIFFFFLLFLILVGCQSRDYIIHFDETMILQYGTEKNTIDLIDRIGDIAVTDEMKKDNVLTYDTLKIECERVDTSVLTEYEVTYKTNNSDNRFITKTVKIRDTTAPVITFKGLDSNKSLSIKKDEFSEYNFNRNIDVKDNCDQKPQTEVKVEKVADKDEYQVLVTATDKFDNVSTDRFIIRLLEEKKDENDSSKKDNHSSGNSNNSNSSSNSNKTTDKNTGSSSSNHTSSYKPKEKDFTIDTYNSFDECLNACEKYIESCMENGYVGMGKSVPIKRDGLNIGYRAVFK